MIEMTTPDPSGTDPFLALQDGDRQQAYAALTADGPVHWVRFPSGMSGWLITSYEVARSAMADPRLSKRNRDEGQAEQMLPRRVVAAINYHLLNLDPPDHTRLRRLLTAAFTRRRSEALAPRIQAITDDLLDRLERRLKADDGPVDLIAEFAYPLPITVICELLGIPEADRGDSGPGRARW